MNYYDIKNPDQKVSLKEAVLKSISAESGLYMPDYIPALPGSFFTNLSNLNLQEIAFEVSNAMLGGDIPKEALKQIVTEAISFPIPLKKLDESLFVLELFHGPTLAFKDVGARFMAGLFQYFLRNENREVVILVATSGDTGSAVANAFYNSKGVKVVILYPSGKVSELQEKQLTTMGGNITALEVEGNFDDCQRMVKQAFADAELNQKLNLTSANSINFARLFPQSFFYFNAIAQLGKVDKPVVISVPSGNFGNLTSGLIAKNMGLPVHRFIAATNRNHVVPDYLKSGEYQPQQTHHTITNAMDVGNPSNFPRMLEIYEKQQLLMAADIQGYWYTDDQTRTAMVELQKKYDYQSDPHGAVAYAGLKESGLLNDNIGIFLETAHPAKFPEEVEKSTHRRVQIPETLMEIMKLEKKSIQIPNDYSVLLEYLNQLV
ncbi:MAG: threonine synthase [Bacteroidales bacterium]|nr:threonine synthase [Bacteroidales bacterium]